MNNLRIRTHRGATLPLVVFALTALLGMAALAIDLNMMALARQRAQAVADAAALAGAGAAQTGTADAGVGPVVAANNAGTSSAFQGAVVSTGGDGSVSVAGYVNAPLSFAPAVGYAPSGADGTANAVSVRASATALVGNVCALPPGMPVAPFGVIGDDPANTDKAVAYVSALLSGAKTVTPGVYQPASQQVVLKLNLWDQSGKLVVPGSFDPLLTSGTGASYFDTIRQTSDQAVSAGQVFQTPPLPYDDANYTRQYLAARLSPSNTAYSHAYVAYDAWFGAGGPEMPDGAHPEDHLLIVPVVSQAVKNKPGNVTVLAFATFFVDQPYPKGLPGNGIALGRFIGLTIPTGSGGGCLGAGSKTLPRLTQ